MRLDQHAIRTGHQTVGSFTTNDIIRNFDPVDGQGVIEWASPILNVEQVPIPAVLKSSMDEKVYPNGKYQFSWTFDLWTVGMWDYFTDAFLADGAWWADVTVRTYDLADNAVYVQCRIKRPTNVTLFRESTLRNIKFDFRMGEIIT
jgi:hypothetical protein